MMVLVKLLRTRTAMMSSPTVPKSGDAARRLAQLNVLSRNQAQKQFDQQQKRVMEAETRLPVVQKARIAAIRDEQEQISELLDAKKDFEASKHFLTLATQNWSYCGGWIAAHIDWQARARAFLSEQSSPESACEFALSPLRHLTIRERTSVSATVVGFAQLASHDVKSQNLHNALLDGDREAFDRVSLKISFPHEELTREALDLLDPDQRSSYHLHQMSNALDFERQCIREAFSNMIDNLWCPHVVAPLADWTCRRSNQPVRISSKPDDHAQGLFAHAVKRLEIEQSWLNQPIDPTAPGTHTLVMERGTGTLHQLILSLIPQRQSASPLQTPQGTASKGKDDHVQAPPLSLHPPLPPLLPAEVVMSDHEFYGLFFQCFYTLACFYRLGINHNDLHMNNILFRQLEAPEDLLYSIDGPAGKPVLVHLKTRFIIKFFDLDRGSAYFPRVQRNMSLDIEHCDDVGECAGLFSLNDAAGFTLSALGEISKRASHFTSSNDLVWVTPEWEERFFELLNAVSDSSTYLRFIVARRPNEYVQHWPHYARQLVLAPEERDIANNINYQNMLDAMRSPEKCMRDMITNRLIHVAPIMPPLYALDHPFSLPLQVSIHLGHPSRAMLGLTEHAFYEDLTHIPRVECPLPVASALQCNAQQFSGIAANLNNFRWARVLGIWREELARNNLPHIWRWPGAAAELWAHLLRVNHHFPSIPEQRPLALACLTLTCPMFYGMPHAARQQFRAAFAHGQHIDNVSLVAACERFVWESFDNKSLPVDIPALYDQTNSDEPLQILPPTRQWPPPPPPPPPSQKLDQQRHSAVFPPPPPPPPPVQSSKKIASGGGSTRRFQYPTRGDTKRMG